MKLKKFFSLYSYIIGTIIIISGFIIMFSQINMEMSALRMLLSFTYTISGLIFWGIGVKLNPDGFSLKKIVDVPSLSSNADDRKE